MSLHWKYKGGPKNGGKFSYFDGRRFCIGLNHKPMTKNARRRFLTLQKKGWRVA